MHIVPTGIDLKRFETEPDPDALKELRERYGIAEGELVLMTAGRLTKEKNMEELIEGLYRTYGTSADPLPVGCSKMTLMVVGGGPHGEMLKARALACGKQYGRAYCRVIFTGEIRQEEMPLHYWISDCYVNASVSETQGLTYIEAMACGLPTVCRRDECLEGLIHHGKNGFTFEDRESFAGALLQVFESRERYETLSRGARSSVERYTMEQFCENVEQVYIRALRN